MKSQNREALVSAMLLQSILKRNAIKAILYHYSESYLFKMNKDLIGTVWKNKLKNDACAWLAGCEMVHASAPFCEPLERRQV